jgi:hypothetical protein
VLLGETHAEPSELAGPLPEIPVEPALAVDVVVKLLAAGAVLEHLADPFLERQQVFRIDHADALRAIVVRCRCIIDPHSYFLKPRVRLQTGAARVFVSVAPAF